MSDRGSRRRDSARIGSSTPIFLRLLRRVRRFGVFVVAAIAAAARSNQRECVEETLRSSFDLLECVTRTDLLDDLPVTVIPRQADNSISLVLGGGRDVISITDFPRFPAEGQETMPLTCPPHRKQRLRQYSVKKNEPFA